MPKTSMLEHRANLSRTGFDMSQSLAFTASTGMILPVYSDLLNAGETVHYSPSLFARTQPLVTAAMADVDIYIDWFFVPCTMLFTPWGQIRWQTNDFVTSLFVQNTNGTVGSFEGSGQGCSGFPLLSEVSYAPASGASNWNLPQIFSINPTQQTTGSGDSNILYYSASDVGFETAFKSMFRLLDLFGFNPYGVFQNTSPAVSSSTENPDVFPLKALAYQCIYQNYYRNDDYEVRDILTYNWDSHYSATSAIDLGANSGNFNPRNPFILRYADYRRDYFTSVRPSPIMSAINSLTNPFNSSGTNNSNTAFNILQNINNFLGNEGLQFRPAANSSSSVGFSPGSQISSGASSGTSVTQVIQSQSSASQNFLSTGNLRSLFAVEKLMRITGRAAKDYDSQTLAHFGFKVPHDVKHQLTHLGSDESRLQIGDVISTSDTYNGSTGSALGEIAGKGYVSMHGKKTRKFTAPVDGVFMATFRAIPRVRAAAGFDKSNAITDRLSLYIPEFDKLGAQPLFNYEVGFGGIGSSAQIGWQNRYEQFKRKYDRVTAAFRQDPRSDSFNQYSSWVLTYEPFTSSGQITNNAVNWPTVAMSLKCPPTALNNIMAVPYQPTVSDSFAQTPYAEFYTDPFIVDFRANVKKVSTMSRTGEPDMVSL